MLFKNLTCISLCLAIQFTTGAILFRDPDELPLEYDYDYIVVGGGTAGGVVASRLGENQVWRILIIEAGPSNEDIFATRPPGAFRVLAKSRVDWNYTTIPQVGLNGRTLGYTRGRLLGGCSSYNGLWYTRGSRDDWDRWAHITEDEGLRWDNMFPYLLKSEKWTNDSEDQLEGGHFDPSVHGYNGKISVTAPYSIHPLNKILKKATGELTDEFPFKLDINDGRPIGVGWRQYTIDHHGERSSSATAYLAKTGNNVHILLNTYVTRIVPTGPDTRDFRTVQFRRDNQSTERQLRARREVILSGGAIGTPHILLRSGIGKPEELEAVGIPTLVENPSVGKNLTDQVSTLVMFNTTIQNTDFDQDAAMEEWNMTRTGPMALPSSLNHAIFVRLPRNTTLFTKNKAIDLSAGENSPHIELTLSQISSHPPKTTVDVPRSSSGSTDTTIQLLAVNLLPASRGSVGLRSLDPFEPPILDFGLLSQGSDIAVLREAVRSAQRLFTASVFKNSVSGTALPAPSATTDEDFDRYIRSAAAPYLHAIGSASMSPKGATWGVVDPDFRVKGTTGLRVVDASVIPLTPSGHSQAPVYGFAERASDLIAGLGVSDSD